jgi:hypothetical protein
MNTIDYALRFDPGVAGRESMAGMGTTERGVFFGFKDDVFGMRVVLNGCREYAKLMITSAPTSPGYITITIGGRSVSIGVAYGMTIGQTMVTIAYSTALAAVNLRASTECNRVEIFTVEASAYETTPTVDFGTTGVTGTIERSKAGYAPTTYWTPWTDFNQPLAGPTLSDFDYGMWNVFQLRFNQFSAGGVVFSALDRESGVYVPLHSWRSLVEGERFDTAVPYVTSINVRTTGTDVSSNGGVKVSGGSVLNGIPATAGIKARMSRQFVKYSVATSSSGDSACGVIAAPVVQDGSVRNTGINTIYDIRISVKSSIDVVCTAILSGVCTVPFDCVRFFPWSSANTSDVTGNNYVYGGMKVGNLFVATGDNAVHQMECDQIWICPGMYISFCVRAARPEDVGTAIDSVAYSVAFMET